MKIEFKTEQLQLLVKSLAQLSAVKNGIEKRRIEDLINVIMFGNEFMDSDDKGERKKYTEL